MSTWSGRKCRKRKRPQKLKVFLFQNSHKHLHREKQPFPIVSVQNVPRTSEDSRLKHLHIKGRTKARVETGPGPRFSSDTNGSFPNVKRFLFTHVNPAIFTRHRDSTADVAEQKTKYTTVRTRWNVCVRWRADRFDLWVDAKRINFQISPVE